MPKIKEIYVFIATGEDPDDEGVVAQLLGNNWFPLIAADEARLKSLRQAAKRIAGQTKRKVTLIKFTVREDIEVISPQESLEAPANLSAKQLKELTEGEKQK